MSKLPYSALEHGYSRVETLDLVYAELYRTWVRLKPYHDYRFPFMNPTARTAEARRAARRFVSDQLYACSAALEFAAAKEAA